MMVSRSNKDEYQVFIDSLNQNINEFNRQSMAFRELSTVIDELERVAPHDKEAALKLQKLRELEASGEIDVLRVQVEKRLTSLNMHLDQLAKELIQVEQTQQIPAVVPRSNVPIAKTDSDINKPKKKPRSARRFV